MNSDSEQPDENITPSYADTQDDENPVEGCYSLSIVRSRFYPNERLSDEEVGYDLKELVDARDIISATDHVAELLIENRSERQFPGGWITDITVFYGTGVQYDRHQITEDVEIEPIEAGEKTTVIAPIGPPESPPLCLIDFKISSINDKKVIIHPSDEGPSKNGIRLKAPVIDRESLRILRELTEIKSYLGELV